MALKGFWALWLEAEARLYGSSLTGRDRLEVL